MKTRSLLLASCLVVFNPITLPVFAEVKIDEQEIGSVSHDAQYVVSEHGGHVVAAGHKGSRFVVTVDGTAGPKFDEIRTVTDYIDPRGVDQTQARSRIKPVVFSKDGSRYAYVGRQGNEFVVIADGKELLRAPVENPNQVDVRCSSPGMMANICCSRYPVIPGLLCGWTDRKCRARTTRAAAAPRA